jgi:outer membrane protein TolC
MKISDSIKKNKMKKYFASSALILLAISATAQVTSNNELKDLIGESFNYYPRMREALNQVDIAQESLNLAKTNVPVVSGTASYEYVQPKITLPLEINGVKQNFQFAPVNNLNANIGADFVLLDFGRLKANIDKSKSDLKYAIDNVSNAQTQLASQVSTVYYNIIYLKKAMAVEDSVLNYLDSNKIIAQNKLKNGDAIKLDVLNLQSQIDVETNRKEDLLNNLQKQLTLLQYTAGSTQVADNSFDFDVNIQTAQDALSNAKENIPDFVLAEDRVQQAKANLNITKLTDKPYLSLNANAGVKNGYVPDVNTPKFNYAAGATLKIPIYNARTKKQVAVAESQVKQNQLAQQTLNNEYEKNIQQALTDIQTNAEKINNMQSQIETATSAKQIASSRYLNGIGLNTDITNAAVNLQRILLTRLQYEYQLCLAKIEYARLTGYKYW